MSIQKYIKEHIDLLGNSTYTAPSIPDKKLNGAITSYAQDVNLEYVVALQDTSILSSGKEGCLFLGDAVYLKTSFEKPLKLEYASIESVSYSTFEKAGSFGKLKRVEQVEAIMNDGTTHDLTSLLLNVNLQGFAELINGILAEAENGKDFVNTSQITPLSEMTEEIKVNYIKIVANFAYSDDQTIDVYEYTEIISLLSRIELSSSRRLEIRSYLSHAENMISTEALLTTLKDSVEEGSFEILSKSLFKDILYIFGTQHNIQEWSQNQFLTELARSLCITTEEIELIIAAIQNDEDILKHRKNDNQIKKAMKDLSAKAVAVGVPMAAIYFSGSVVGLSAAGITSGLAAMGMGGLLGFSSMFTGIGALVLIGVGTYHGLKKVSGIGDLENNKQREFMLQAIIRNSQKSLSFLIEDINAITQQLMVEMKKGNENSEKIQKLSKLLDMLSRGAQMSAEKQNMSQIEQVITKLPAKLDMDRLMGLTNKPTLEKVRQFILSCYVALPVAQDNEQANVKPEFTLREGLTLSDVESLHNCFTEIEYNKVTQAVFASATTKAKNLFR
ncbi:hypothetical protein NCCP2222_33200 [Sporosarcina sp. NCCP-2222]|uniref:hypothetical protein n=1 Tax=Sporosarcina sp. NCCP-2222 TaxID=2935073 RepID=UPI00208BF08E|nr:hypothetical protein [Sporosarcina sp. NCCP-2222]GKV57373.1 hypothetical protein NCCP2222_33200 [Sporosarcina sp. NCCP-2222]